MNRKAVDIAVVIPDASPVLTLAGIGRIDLLDERAHGGRPLNFAPFVWPGKS
jgi:hypothetical protein